MREYEIEVGNVVVAAENEQKAKRQVSNALGRSPGGFDIVGSIEIGEPEAPKVKLKFHPQRWVDGRARPVEPDGDETWYIPLEDALTEENAIVESQSYEADELKDHVFAPLWVQRWGGPFTITIEDIVVPGDQTVEEYFETEVDMGELEVRDCIPPEHQTRD